MFIFLWCMALSKKKKKNSNLVIITNTYINKPMKTAEISYKSG